MRDMFFLGAGASVEAGIPGTYKMTSALLDFFDDGTDAETYEFLKKVIELVNPTYFEKDNQLSSSVNLEDIISLLYAIVYESDSRLAPITIYNFIHSKKDPDLAKKSIYRAWCFLDSIMWVSTDKTDYLNPILAYCQNSKEQTVIAAINYDNTIENLFQSADVKLYDGIHSYSKTGRYQLPSQNPVLLKIHGSITWQSESKWPQNPVSQDVVTSDRKRFQDVVEGQGKCPEIIWGRDEKLRKTGPFLQLLSTFQSALDKADRLFVIGYSFNDTHINEIFATWLNQKNPKQQLVIIDPDPWWKKDGVKAEPRLPFDLEYVQQKTFFLKGRAGEVLHLLEETHWDPTQIPND